MLFSLSIILKITVSIDILDYIPHLSRFSNPLIIKVKPNIGSTIFMAFLFFLLFLFTVLL